MEKGSFAFLDTDEDIHTAVERAVIERAGEAGSKLRTARSRNDQIASRRAPLSEEGGYFAICRLLLGLSEALAEQAAANLGAIMPGFTHLQPAQPVLLSHHLLAFVEMFKRDVERMRDAHRRMDVSLGSGALAGVTFPEPGGHGRRAGLRADQRQFHGRSGRPRFRGGVPLRRTCRWYTPAASARN